MFVLDSDGDRLEFLWNFDKAAENLKKHKVAFTEAAQVFVDSHARVIYDEAHSSKEDRWLMIGDSPQGRTLVVVFTDEGGRIRIVSARRATRRERNG